MRGAVVVLAVLLAGCAGTPEEEGLLASSAVVNAYSVEEGEVVEVGQFSGLRPGSPVVWHWEPYLIHADHPRTTYRPAEVDGVVCVEADATPQGQSGLQRLIRISPQRHPVLEWRWRVLRHASGEQPSRRPSPRARLMLAFHGDPKNLDLAQRIQMRMAKAFTGRGLPYATLIYVWQDGEKPESVLHSPYTERVRLIALPTGPEHLERWMAYRRDVRADFRRAFGEEPGDIVGVGIYTDVDHDGRPGRACYGDITFRRAP
jgi:hypothetical protein